MENLLLFCFLCKLVCLSWRSSVDLVFSECLPDVKIPTCPSSFCPCLNVLVSHLPSGSDVVLSSHPFYWADFPQCVDIVLLSSIASCVVLCISVFAAYLSQNLQCLPYFSQLPVSQSGAHFLLWIHLTKDLKLSSLLFPYMSLCLSGCVLWGCLQSPEEALIPSKSWTLRAGVTGRLAWREWELNAGPLKEQQELLATLRPHSILWVYLQAFFSVLCLEFPHFSH